MAVNSAPSASNICSERVFRVLGRFSVSTVMPPTWSHRSGASGERESAQIGDLAVIVSRYSFLQHPHRTAGIGHRSPPGGNWGQFRATENPPSAGPNPPHLLALLLRACRERPRGRRTAEQRDELAALHLRGHSITSSARASSVGGTSMSSALAVC